MDSLAWGFTGGKRERTYEENDEPKRPKLFQSDKMIYSVGTEIHFTSGINNESIEKIIRKITKIIKENHKKYVGTTDKLNITYIVDSPGGSVSAILKFVDFINMVRWKYPYVEFTSVITGLVASAGTIMCIVADKRMMTKNGHAMIHELSSGNSGKYTHLMSYSRYLNKLHETLMDIYIKGTKGKQTKANLEKLLYTESWYDAEEYLDGGFVDVITA